MGVKVEFLLLILSAFSVLGSADPAFSPKQAPSRLNGIKRGKIETLPRNDPYHNARHSSIALPPSTQHESPSPSAHRNHHHHHVRSHHGIPKSFHLTPRPSNAPSGHSSMSWHPLAPAPSPTSQSSRFHMSSHPPATSPIGSHLKKIKAPHTPEIMSLPPPPPNRDCPSLTCTDPLTYTPPGTFCGCVWPIQVKLQLSVPIYTFFTMVTELAEEIGGSVALNHTQVRIMGANAATQQLEKSVVLINLVPDGLKFTKATAFSIYNKFWSKKVLIKPALFGSYEVLYVRYPGLPPSPPSPLSISTIANKPLLPGGDQKGGPAKPLGVDVPRGRNHGLGGGVIALIVVSSFAALCAITAIAWLLLLKCGNSVHQNPKTKSLHNTPEKPPEAYGPANFGERPNSASNSFRSGPMTYAGSAKVLIFSDIERATDNFDPSKVLGEGGFGLVYSGKLDDGRMVAVKVLKRAGQHGTREFLAEVEMLSRLHHRNLVKLIGICTEENARCLVYELIPNGSVESHLHGVDKERDPLDWDARMKIALGAARGLAYLHEDSSPRVIHRDFKSSNILLEHDFTPKVSDFGLARAAMEEGNKLISTHVMGTFGYLAPEYAMTGHLLVKSDVYSYGVVLLELLTGRKPVDFTQPPGQENLVAYARPLLTSKDGLEMIVDPAMKPVVSYDTLSKVAAIASMCVQPEVSHRPFMGEVVQALKLVCNEFDDTKDQRSGSLSRENLLVDVDSTSKGFSGDVMEVSKPELFSAPIGIGLEEPEMQSFVRYSSSGPLRTGTRNQFWERLRNMSRGSVSERGFSLRFWLGNS